MVPNIFVGINFHAHFYFPRHVVYVRKYCDGEKIGQNILTGLHVLGPADKKVVLPRRLSVCLSVCMCASPAPERIARFYSHPVNMGPSNEPKNTKWPFFRKRL
jgi:hypothetical protein